MYKANNYSFCQLTLSFRQFMYLRLEQLVKKYPSTIAVNNLSLDLAESKTLALLGSSGCGKSTLLRLIAGLEKADSGKIWLKNQDISSKTPKERGFGMVFQDYALFPHLNVEKNIRFGLQNFDKQQKENIVKEMLELVGLSGYEKRKIHELSGGEQQRIAVARALAPEPKLLLLDEPLSNLDRTLRDNLKYELRLILKKLSITAIYVTHDQSEAYALAEQVAIMRDGVLLQIGSTKDVFKKPKTAWIAKFLGHENIYSAEELNTSHSKLLRSELVTITGGNTKAKILEIEDLPEQKRLRLLLTGLGIEMLWTGYNREMEDGLEPNHEISINIPEQAWYPLEEE